MGLLAGKARDRLIALRILRSVLRYEALDSRCSGSDIGTAPLGSFPLRSIVIDLVGALLISIKNDACLPRHPKSTATMNVNGRRG
jgi:hypothetical protein